MIRLAKSFADEANTLLSSLRANFQQQAGRLKTEGHKRALICGCDTLADMAASALQNAGIKPAGVVAADTTIGGVAGMDVIAVTQASDIPCDMAVVFSKADARRLRRRLKKTVRIVQFPAISNAKEPAHGR